MHIPFDSLFVNSQLLYNSHFKRINLELNGMQYNNDIVSESNFP